MRARVSSHIRSNVVGYIALFCFAMSGTASALSGHNTVFSDDIVKREVKRSDLARNAVNSAKVATDSLTTADINDSTLTPAWSKLTGVPAGFADGVDNGAGGAATDVACASPCVSGSEVVDDSLGGADINEGSLSQVPSAVLGGVGRWTHPANCNPTSTTFIDCGFVSLTLNSQARVLMIGAARGFSPSGSGFGFCRLVSSQGVVTGSDVGIDVGDAAGLTAMTNPIGPGSIDFGIECKQVTSDVQYEDLQISAVALAPN